MFSKPVYSVVIPIITDAYYLYPCARLMSIFNICNIIYDVDNLTRNACKWLTRKSALRKGLSWKCVKSIFEISNASFLLLNASFYVFVFQGCVKVWDISQSGNKNPISQLDCLVRLLFTLKYVESTHNNISIYAEKPDLPKYFNSQT